MPVIAAGGWRTAISLRVASSRRVPATAEPLRVRFEGGDRLAVSAGVSTGVSIKRDVYTSHGEGHGSQAGVPDRRA